MPYLPELPTWEKTVINTQQFLGLNRGLSISDGEMADMLNMSSDNFPVLSTRKSRGKPMFDGDESRTEYPEGISGMLGTGKLIVCAGTKVYMDGQELPLTISDAEDMKPKQLVSMGAYVCIWPDKVYFNISDAKDYGDMGMKWTPGEGQEVTAMMCRRDGTDYDMEKITVAETPPEAPEDKQFWLDTSETNDVLKQYSEMYKEWVQVATTYIKIQAEGIGKKLKEFDVLHISGVKAADGADEDAKQLEALNTTNTIYGCGDNYIIVAGLLRRMTRLENTIETEMKIPDMDYVCEANNRLWGCCYTTIEGTITNEIRACALGDFRNWYKFAGISTDSYALSVGSDGPFTGAYSLRGMPIIWKEDYLHKITGTMPSNFTLNTIRCRGVQKGSWRSLAVVNELLYYKSRTDVMAYDGAMPYAVGERLGQERYGQATGGNYRDKYYLSMKDEKDGWHVYVLDTVKGLWHKEDESQIPHMANVDGDLVLAVNEDGGTLLRTVGSDHGSKEDFNWSVTFGVMGFQSEQQKYLSRYNIRCQMSEASHMKVEIQYDSNGKWMHMGTIRSHKLRTFLLPIIPRRCDHCQLRISGTGKINIYSVAREYESGGDG